MMHKSVSTSSFIGNRPAVEEHLSLAYLPGKSSQSDHRSIRYEPENCLEWRVSSDRKGAHADAFGAAGGDVGDGLLPGRGARAAAGSGADRRASWRTGAAAADRGALAAGGERRGRSAAARGRPTIAMETFLRLMVIKQRSEFGYETLCRNASSYPPCRLTQWRRRLAGSFASFQSGPFRPVGRHEAMPEAPSPLRPTRSATTAGRARTKATAPSSRLSACPHPARPHPRLWDAVLVIPISAVSSCAGPAGPAPSPSRRSLDGQLSSSRSRPPLRPAAARRWPRCQAGAGQSTVDNREASRRDSSSLAATAGAVRTACAPLGCLRRDQTSDRGRHRGANARHRRAVSSLRSGNLGPARRSAGRHAADPRPVRAAVGRCGSQTGHQRYAGGLGRLVAGVAEGPDRRQGPQPRYGRRDA
jgi:hypothetical protein